MGKRSSLFALLATVLIVCGVLTTCTTRKEPCDLSQVVIGEWKQGVPLLAYENTAKLTRAMQLAFLPTMVIDTIFLRVEQEDDQGADLVLTAGGQETDSTYSSVNFQLRAPKDKPITWGLVGPEPSWCTGFCIMNNEFGRCFGTNNDCTCMPGDTPCEISTTVIGTVSRPQDIAKIIIPYLAAKETK